MQRASTKQPLACPIGLRLGWFVALAAVWLHGASICRGGGGPESTIVVVNSRSWASVTVANHFIRLRQIPPSNVFYVDWTQSIDGVPIEDFRQQLLVPILGAIARRSLNNQIDCIAYSSDLPYAVDFQQDLGKTQLPKPLRPIGSLTGLTYLYQGVLARDPNRYMALDANRYMRRAIAVQRDQPTLAFHSWYGWGADGQMLEAGGSQYILAIMLAVTSGRGNSVTEVVDYLTSSALADGTRPKGTIYFAKTSDVRSKTREPAFESTVKALGKLGVKAEIVTQVLPQRRKDVQGAVLGSPQVNWRQSQSKILPGAICENLTSSGGVMDQSGGQTPLSEFLRYGAAGTSGTVTEPYALQEKFPFPFVQVHYARGSSLAESFYQSIHGPYQLLVVGDPLCRPWAFIPKVEVGELQSGAALSGTIELKPTGKSDSPAPVERFELFVDGMRRSQCAAGETLRLDTALYGDGYHELRIVAIDDSQVENQGRLVLPVTFANHDHQIEVTPPEKDTIGWRQPLSLAVRCVGATRIVVLNNHRPLASVDGTEGMASIDPKSLGLGPVALQVIGITGTAPKDLVFAPPVELNVIASGRLAALTPPAGAKTKKGLELSLAGGKPVVIDNTLKTAWLEDAGVKLEQPYKLSGLFEVPINDVYQFQIRYYGKLQLKVDGQLMYEGLGGRDNTYVPMALAKGWHRLEIDCTPDTLARLDLRFGGPGSQSVGAERFSHGW